MKAQKLILENFRGIKELQVNLSGRNAAVYGANGTGKTTIANAVCWLLCGAPATGEKDFSPQTQGTHDLHHKAELTVDADGNIVSIAKDFYEKWTKKRGSKSRECTGHVTDYYVNDVPVKKSEYEKKVSELLGGLTSEQAKTLLLLGYFAEQGVMTAYCLDGGQTGEVVFKGEPYNYIDFNKERQVSDIIYFATALPEEGSVLG